MTVIPQVRWVSSFVAAGVCALAAVGLYLRYSHVGAEPEPIAFHRAILRSDLIEVDKEILSSLASDSRAWESGLMNKIVGDVSMKRVAWRSEALRVSGARVFIVLMDSFVTPAANSTHPLICIVFRTDDTMLTWAEVAPWSRGLYGAEIVTRAGTQVVLRITTYVNYGAGLGSYEYALSADDIVRIDGDGDEWDRPSRANSNAGQRPMFLADPKSMKEVLERLRQSRVVFTPVGK